LVHIAAKQTLDPLPPIVFAESTEGGSGGGSLNEKYSNVSGRTAGSMFPEGNADPGNGSSSRVGELPRYGVDWSGKKSTKTLGVLEVPGKGDVYLQSGNRGPSDLLSSGTPGFDAYSKTHVEGHASAILRLEGINSARLYLNQAPCPSCMQNLRYMVPQEGAKLEIFAPNYYGVFP
jgi:hypothetical protein